MEDICNIVETAIMLHNMMVSFRVDYDDVESSDWYEYPADIDPVDGDPYQLPPIDDSDSLQVERVQNEIDHIRAIERATFGEEASSSNMHNQYLNRSVQFLSLRQETVSRRWNRLYDPDSHFRLRLAIMEQIWQNSSSLNIEL